MKDYVDNKALFDLALEQAGKGTTFYINSDSVMGSMSVEERVMFIGFVYTVLMSNAGFMPKSARNNMCMKINTQVQSIAAELNIYRECSKKTVEFIEQSEMLRTELTHALNADDKEKALQLAVKLVDIATFGPAAENGIYSKTLKKSPISTSVPSGKR